jgi:hypothetical protein
VCLLTPHASAGAEGTAKRTPLTAPKKSQHSGLG